ncbi:mechanosensitive ion channel family protein [Luteimonas arsenica]|uniref:mechanosensitive ion channel family protein n=1 Tax=Luteimonas arsenica TaxID=1586242 RepID=UPI001404B43C|nr:mechanosensitive ion channel family protein [Luteimonas arsenica]
MRADTIRTLATSLLLSLALSMGVAQVRAQDTVDEPGVTAVREAPEAADAPAEDSAEGIVESRRVARRLQEADGLADVTVTVRGGVAELQGVVLSPEDRERAEQLVAQQPGIERVENRVTLSTRLSDRVATATALALDKVGRLLAALPLLLVAIAVVGLAWWLGKWMGRRVGRRITRRNWQSDNPFFASLVQQLVQWLVLLGGVLVALDLLGATALVGAVMGSAGVIGLALGFAFKDIAENYVAGVLLSIRRPFAPGELLRIDGSHEGRVAALTSRATVLVTADGNRLTLPNALVFKSVVLNYSSNPKRRLEFTIPLDVEESIRNAQELALEALREVEGVLADPAPSWTVDAYDASGITLRFFAWVDQRRSDLGKVRREAIHAVRARLAECGVSTPRNIQYTANLADAPLHPAEEAPALAGMDSVADTSVDRDLDAHLAAEQRAHAGEDLLPAEDGADAGPAQEHEQG